MAELINYEFNKEDRAKLTLKISLYTSVFSFVFGVVCLLFLDIYEVIPQVLFLFGGLNLINTLLYKSHKNLALTYNIISILGLTCATIITLYSGGINSAFIFVLAIVVFAGYATTRAYGKVYLYLAVLIIGLIFFQGNSDFSITKNVVPEGSQNIFSFISVLFAVYLLGGVLGKNLLKLHTDLFKAKTIVDERIKEKETLLQEVHHRVKNNLQTVSSLLSLQSRGIEDQKVKNLIKSSQNRVISMAMVHEMLYMRDDLSKIEYKSYVEELSEYLVKSVKGADSKVQVNINIPQIELGIDTAIPLGLLINEALTNALKYGIKDNDEGVIHIELQKKADKNYVLNIGDNGVGFPEEVNFKNSRSLGLKLIHNLARQLQGSIKRDLSKKGTNYIIKFQEIGQTEFHPTVA
ncbi:sensor histidine kinase [Eudoraea chungangensis]|uniref:sensor histidine kinase n=1 Tax=Eudoraea chungangensis TaxID=1481905 RepID=UPI0023EC18D8|nr:histidine kinase dimerization/phosphoacceptor domain -containing protein [Eudoraea chungangensis]